MKKEVVLAYFPKITCKRYQELLRAFLSLDEVWKVEFNEFKAKLPWEENLIQEFLLWRDGTDENKIERQLKKEKIHCIVKDDTDYPKQLAEIYDPPFCLFVRGKLEQYNFPVAVVGTRSFTTYGKQVTEEIVGELAARGVTIISGLALGIDGIAHEACLKSGGKTVAVLGTGIDRQHVYPYQHKALAERIILNGGAIISEYPPGSLPTKFSFPKRNRIIAGMSLGTLVTESAEKSGALITATFALESGREIFAVPQNIHAKTSAGPNNLLKMGAKPVTSAEDILQTLNLQNIEQFVNNKKIIPDSPTEAKILEYLSREPTHVDDLIKKSNLTSQIVNSTLTLMEMKGKVSNLGGMMYVARR